VDGGVRSLPAFCPCQLGGGPHVAYNAYAGPKVGVEGGSGFLRFDANGAFDSHGAVAHLDAIVDP
jgi:hypothetical protein